MGECWASSGGLEFRLARLASGEPAAERLPAVLLCSPITEGGLRTGSGLWLALERCSGASGCQECGRLSGAACGW